MVVVSVQSVMVVELVVVWFVSVVVVSVVWFASVVILTHHRLTHRQQLPSDPPERDDIA